MAENNNNNVNVIANSDAKLVPRFKKLATGGDIYQWLTDIELHFESLGLWNLVGQQPPAVGTEEGAEADRNQKKARCKRDILLSLDHDIQLAVRHLSDPHEMFARVKKMYVGGMQAQRAKLRQKLNLLQFTKSYFTFMTKYQALVSQLIALGGIYSYKDVAMQFLDKLPRSLGTITYPLREHIEAETTCENRPHL